MLLNAASADPCEKVTRRPRVLVKANQSSVLVAVPSVILIGILDNAPPL